MSKNTPCIRCGRIRIEGKSWTQKINGSVVVYTETVCPDPACQKEVEKELKKKMDKMKNIQQKSLERRKMIKRRKLSK